MATHNDQSNYSPTSNVFYNNVYSTPESPTFNHRKRKQQQEFTYHQNNNGLDSLYQTWNPNNQQNNHQDFIVPITSSSSSTTATYHQQDDIKSSALMNHSWHGSTNTQDQFIADSFMNHSSSQKNHNGGGGVGENTEIHQILNLDQPSHFQFVDTTKENTRTLHLNDLGNSRLIHQAWSPQQQHPQQQPQQQFNTNSTNNSNNPSSPGFFTPGFLESLQEDENESPESFPFHVPPPRHWSLDESHHHHHQKSSSMEHDTIMVKFLLNVVCVPNVK